MNRLAPLMGAVGFLTRVPVPHHPEDRSDLARAVGWFPFVGAMIGTVVGGVFVVFALGLPTPAAAVIAVAAGLALTGAFHEDGLADTFDGMSAGRTPERIVAIMSDSRLGTFGVSALATSLALQAILLASLAGGSWEVVLLIAVAHAVSRAASVLVMTTVPMAKQSGLGVDHVDSLERLPTVSGAGSTALVAVLAVGWINGWLAAGLVVAAVVAASGALTLWVLARLDGMTGDTLGAVQQVSLVAALAALAAST